MSTAVITLRILTSLMTSPRSKYVLPTLTCLLHTSCQFYYVPHKPKTNQSMTKGTKESHPGDPHTTKTNLALLCAGHWLIINLVINTVMHIMCHCTNHDKLFEINIKKGHKVELGNPTQKPALGGALGGTVSRGFIAFDRVLKKPAPFREVVLTQKICLRMAPGEARVAPLRHPMTEKAEKQMLEARARNQKYKDFLLFRVPENLMWGTNRSNKDKLFYNESIAKQFGGPLFPWSDQARDEKHMSKFLSRVKDSAHVHLLKGQSHEVSLVGGAPLIDFLLVAAERKDVWNKGALDVEMLQNIAKRRNVTDHLLTDMQVKEIDMVGFSNDELNEAIEFVKFNYDKDQKLVPTGTLSMDVEFMRVTKADREVIYSNMPAGHEALCLDPNWGEKGNGTNIPVRMMIGGSSWALMLRAPVVAHDGNLYLKPLSFKPELTEWLANLPVFVGLGIANDVLSIEDLIHANGDPGFRFKGYLDLGVMAVAAGWNIPYLNMPCMSYLCTGGVMNKSVSCGDNRWAEPWEALPPCLRIYCLADVRFGHQTSVIFYGLLLHRMFPDPDIVLSFLRCDHAAFAKWFGNWVTDSLTGLEADMKDIHRNIQNIDDLMEKSLTYRLLDGNRSGHLPSRADIFRRCWTNGPSVPWGGHRYLHSARFDTYQTLAMLDFAEVHGWRDLAPRGIQLFETEKFEAAVYGIPQYNSFEWGDAIESPTPFGLVMHKGIANMSVAHKKAYSIPSSAVIPVAENNNRIVREMVMEWARINCEDPQFIGVFLSLVNRDSHYTQWKKTYYSEVRMICMRATGSQPAGDPNLNNELERSADEEEAVERRMIAEADAKIQRCKDQVEEIQRKANLEIQRIQLKQREIEQYKRRREDRLEIIRESRPSFEGVPSSSWRGQRPEVFPCRRVNRSLDPRKESRTDRAAVDLKELVANVKEVAQATPAYKFREDDECVTVGRHPKPRAKKRKPSWLRQDRAGESLAQHWNPDPESSTVDSEEESMVVTIDDNGVGIE